MKQCFETDCIESVCGATPKNSVIYLVDQVLEGNMGLASSWPYDDPAIDECYADTDLAESLGVAVGDTIIVSIDFKTYYPEAWRVVIADPRDYQNGFVHFPLKIAGLYDPSIGKYSIESGAGFVVAYSTFFRFMGENSSPFYTSKTKEKLLDFDAYQYAEQIMFNLDPSERIDIYLNTAIAPMQAHITSWAGFVSPVSIFNFAAISNMRSAILSCALLCQVTTALLLSPYFSSRHDDAHRSV